MQQIIYWCETPKNCCKVEFISNDVFCSRLMSWNTAIPQGTADRILMRLDEYNSGGVTPHNLTRVLGNMSLQEFVGSYSRGAVHFLQIPLFELLMWGTNRGETISSGHVFDTGSSWP